MEGLFHPAYSYDITSKDSIQRDKQGEKAKNADESKAMIVFTIIKQV